MIMNYENARNIMLTQQLRPHGVLEQKVLNVIGNLPREQFVAENLRPFAYADTTLALGQQQIMLAPKEQGIIVQALSINPGDTILEIGTGSGYLTAILANLGQTVTSIEIINEFTIAAKQRLQALAIDNIKFIADDANHCWQQSAPYDVICITAGLALYPENYKQGLKVGGRLFAIIGTTPTMRALMITRIAEETWSETTLFETVVPEMINAPQPETFNL